MNVLVTGGAGFIGSHLTTSLIKNGHNVTVLDNLSSSSGRFIPREVSFINGDICDTRIVIELMTQIDICIHLAAMSAVEICEQSPILAVKNNLMGTLTVFDAALQAKNQSPVIYASSAAVYGKQPYGAFFAENDVTDPRTVYGLTKLQSEQWALSFGSRGLKSFGLRFFNIYGNVHNNEKKTVGCR